MLDSEGNSSHVIIFKRGASYERAKKIRNVSYVAGLGCCIVLLTVSIRVKSQLPWVLSTLAFLALFPGSCAMDLRKKGVFRPIWHVDDVLAPDGQQYFHLACGVMQYQPRIFAKLADEDDQKWTFKVIGSTHGDHPRSFVTVALPSELRPGPFEFSADRSLICFIQGDDCYYAYDWKNDHFIGWGAIESLRADILTSPAASTSK